MKTSLLPIIFAAGFTVAQNLGAVPSCAQECVKQYVGGGKIADCGSLDIKCICSNKDFIGGISCCLERACDPNGLKDAVKFATDICSGVGVKVPDSPQCSTSTNTATGSRASQTVTSQASATSADSGAGALTGGSVGAVVAMLLAL